MGIIDKIRRHQAQAVSEARPLPEHRPEMLYIGCVDARLDPINDIGIQKGGALIFRNIGALAPAYQEPRAGADDTASHPVSLGAVLEFFINHIPAQGEKKHIVVSGHTDCGGLKACWHQQCGEKDHYLPLYLESLRELRSAMLAKASEQHWDEAQVLREMEQESVRRSIGNLRGYPVVRDALAAGTLELHGWVIDTATRRILELNDSTLAFEPLLAQ